MISGLSMAASWLVWRGLGDNRLDTELADGEKIFMLLVNSLFHPVIAGICSRYFGGGHEYRRLSCWFPRPRWRRILQKSKPDTLEKAVAMGRIGVVAISVVPCSWLTPDSSVLDLASTPGRVLGRRGPAVLLSLYWNGMNCNGALAGILVGGITIVVYKHLSGGWFDFNPRLRFLNDRHRGYKQNHRRSRARHC